MFVCAGVCGHVGGGGGGGGGVLCSCEATDLSWSCSRVSTPSAADPVVVSSSAVFPTTGLPANCVNMLTNVE